MEIEWGSNRTRRTPEGVTYHYSLSRHKHTVTLAVWLELPEQFSFHIAKESWFDRAAKKLNISHEFQTGDREFDEAFYISSHAEEPIRPLLRNHEARNAFRALFVQGFGSVEHKKRNLRVTASGTQSHCTGIDIDSAARSLTTVARILSEIPAPRTYSQSSNSAYLSFAAYSSSGLLLATSLLCWLSGIAKYPPLDSMDLFWCALNYALPIYVLYSIFSFLLLRGRSTSHWELLCTLSLSMISMPLLFMGYCAYVNGMNDVSLPQPHQAVVKEKYIEHHKSSKTYFVRVGSWRPGHATETFQVPAQAFEHIIPGTTTIEVVSRAGSLRVEWVESKHF
ncbi:MAG: hypothetical protein U0136_14320 [Bdellovibrionota bacterium]